MADTKNNEPQSYGSQGEWLTGKTGQQVNETAGRPAGSQQEFYDEKRESETNGEHQGGHVSDEQLADSAELSGAPTGEESASVKNVTSAPGGAVRDSFFKDRDYK